VPMLMIQRLSSEFGGLCACSIGDRRTRLSVGRHGRILQASFDAQVLSSSLTMHGRCGSFWAVGKVLRVSRMFFSTVHKRFLNLLQRLQRNLFGFKAIKHLVSTWDS